jgi:hypothetical protein
MAIRPRNSTIRCLLLYFSKPAALPSTMVVPVPAQIPKFSPRLHAANTPAKLLPPSSPSHAPRSAHIRSVLSSFRILPVATAAYSRHCRRRTFRPSGMPTLLFASTCRLFAFSFLLFLHSFPLFSIVCSLFSENTRGGGTSHRRAASSTNPRYNRAAQLGGEGS